MASAIPTVMELRRAFSSAKPPDRITQDAFDSSPKHLHRLARLHPGERAPAKDLWEYTQDLLYGREVQASLAAYLFPFCLEAWREDLRGLTSEYGGFVEYLYPVLANKRTGEHLDPKRMAAVADFMKRTILEEIDDQRGLIYSGGAARPYRWIRALTTYGVLFPDLDRLWSAWWSIETVGKATAIVQYASCLMYPTDENPVFARWTPEGGGGPPCLWEFAGHLYNHQWLDANVAFLKDMLTVQRTIETVDKAVKRLVSEAEFSVAAEIQSDMPLCTETLASRCAELPNMLATDEASKTHEWSL